MLYKKLKSDDGVLIDNEEIEVLNYDLSFIDTMERKCKSEKNSSNFKVKLLSKYRYDVLEDDINIKRGD